MANCLFCGDWNCCGGTSNGSSNYVLPAATRTRLGGIMVGDGLSIDSDGVLSCSIAGGSIIAEDTSESEFVNFVYGGD